MSYSIDALSDDCYPGACRRKGTPHPPRRRLRCHRQPAHRRVACLGRLHAHLIRKINCFRVCCKITPK